MIINKRQEIWFLIQLIKLFLFRNFCNKFTTGLLSWVRLACSASCVRVLLITNTSEHCFLTSNSVFCWRCRFGFNVSLPYLKLVEPLITDVEGDIFNEEEDDGAGHTVQSPGLHQAACQTLHPQLNILQKYVRSASKYCLSVLLYYALKLF